MWALIVSLVYHRSCQNYLAEMARHQHGWM